MGFAHSTPARLENKSTDKNERFRKGTVRERFVAAGSDNFDNSPLLTV